MGDGGRKEGREGRRAGGVPFRWKMRGEKREVVTGRSCPTRLVSLSHFSSSFLAREGGREGGREGRKGKGE